MAEGLKRGDRVKVSREALSRGIFKRCPPGRLGEVYNNPGPDGRVQVWWDGRRSTEYVARLFLERVTG
jgi:hypothetical protein